MDYEKRRQQRIYKKVQEFEAKQKRIVERKEAPVCVDPPAQNENIGPIHDKGEIQVIEKHIPDDMKEAVVVEEVIKTVVETTIVAEPIALAAEQIKKDDLVVEEDEVWNSESHNTAESPNQPKTGIEVKLEKQVTQRQSSSKVGYIIVLTIAITIAFSFIQPRFFKIILSLATEDDSFVVAI